MHERQTEDGYKCHPSFSTRKFLYFDIVAKLYARVHYLLNYMKLYALCIHYGDTSVSWLAMLSGLIIKFLYTECLFL